MPNTKLAKMKILVIDNGTRHIDEICHALDDHEVDDVVYQPGVELRDEGYDLVILSGGSGHTARPEGQSHRSWYADEINFIRRSSAPLLGICMGFELICMAFGDEVEALSQQVHGLRMIHLSPEAKELFHVNYLTEYEAHQWGVKTVNEHILEVLGHSQAGVEIVRHYNRPIFATQFHPEVSGHLRSILKQLVLIPTKPTATLA